MQELSKDILAQMLPPYHREQQSPVFLGWPISEAVVSPSPEQMFSPLTPGSWNVVSQSWCESGAALTVQPSWAESCCPAASSQGLVWINVPEV